MGNTHYIECVCHDLDHITRLWFDEEDKIFYFDIKICRFPGEVAVTQINTKWDHLRHRLRWLGSYFRALWWALKGRPTWYVSQPDYNVEEAEKMAKFILSKTKKEFK